MKKPALPTANALCLVPSANRFKKLTQNLSFS
jgi:hypothetical protein